MVLAVVGQRHQHDGDSGMAPVSDLLRYKRLSSGISTHNYADSCETGEETGEHTGKSTPEDPAGDQVRFVTTTYLSIL